jgi:hypothetical protein
MPIVDFEQDPEMPVGTGNFRDEKGRVMYLSDPETASTFIKTIPGRTLKSNVGAESSAIATSAMGGGAPAAGPDMRTAMNASDTGLPVPVGDVNAPVPGAPGAGAPGAAATQGIDTINQATADLEKSVNAPPAAPAGSPKAVALVGKLDALPKRTTPSAATAPAAPSGGGGGGLPVVGTSSTRGRTVVKGANAANVEKRIGEEDAAMEGTLSAGSKLAESKDARTAAALDTQIAGTQDQYRADGSEAQKAIRAKERAERFETMKRDELKKNDESFDPERYMKSKSSGQKIGMVLLAALNGGFGNLAGQKDNGVLQVIDQEIERDLDDQKQQIASGRIRIGNEIDKYMKQGFDAETAEKLARDRQRSAVAQLAELNAKKTGAAGENAENMAFVATQTRAEQAKRRGDLRATTEDRVQTSDQDVTQRAKPAGGGDPLEALTKQLTLRKLMTEQGLTLDKNGNLVGTGKPTPAELERADKQLESYDTTTAGLTQAQVAFDQALTYGGFRRENGQLVPPKDIPAKGYFDAAAEGINETIGNDTPGTRLNKSVKLLEEAFGRMQSQGAITDEELQNFSGYINSITEDNFTANLKQIDELINGVSERHMRRLGPVALAELAAREQRELPARGGTAKPVTGIIQLPPK